MTYVEEFQEDVVKTFLALILVQMLPLVALEMKIMSCADPVGLFCKFAMPVTLTHAFFLGMRIVMYDTYDAMTLKVSCVGLVAAFVTMIKGFRASLMTVLQCYTVWSLIMLSYIAAFVTSSITLYLSEHYHASWYVFEWEQFFRDVLHNSNSYIELVAFVPAVLMVFRENKNEHRFDVASTDTKRTATAFFLFLVGFYILEDLGNAYNALGITVLASLGHTAHFLLLVDFACYVLAHIYNPDKLVGELRRWLPFDLSYEV